MKKRMIVVGAGASTEVGLPAGSQLKAVIAGSLNITVGDFRQQASGDPVLREALIESAREEGLELGALMHAARAIRHAMPQAISIDNFIDSRRGDKPVEVCGKLAIAKAILEAERRSKIFVDRRNSYNRLNFSGVEESWYNRFFQVLTEGCHVDELPERLSRLVLVIFNYDRCVEHFLHSALSNYYGIDDEAAATLVNSIEIYHPYGQVGRLPWQGGGPIADYGAETDASALRSLAEGLRTFAEGSDPGLCNVNDLKKRVAGSTTMVFLGFAFHPMNMELLRSSLGSEPGGRCLATAYGISEPDSRLIEGDVRSLKIPTSPPWFSRVVSPVLHSSRSSGEASPFDSLGSNARENRPTQSEWSRGLWTSTLNRGGSLCVIGSQLVGAAARASSSQAPPNPRGRAGALALERG